jgi:hypothetical protein
MGVDWDCELGELTQMVPPAYSKYIMTQFIKNKVLN